MTRNNQILIYLVTGLAAVLYGVFVLYLGIVYVKILRELDLWGLDELEVTGT